MEVITDDTPLDAKITMKAIAKYFDLDEYGTGCIKGGFSIAVDNIGFNKPLQCARISFHHVKLLQIFIEDPVYINYGPFMHGREVLKYFDFPVNDIDPNNCYDFKVYGEVKKLLCPLLRVIEKYRSIDIVQILFEKLIQSEKMNETLISGLCLSNGGATNEMIFDIIEKKDNEFNVSKKLNNYDTTIISNYEDR